MGRRFDRGKRIQPQPTRTPHGYLLAEVFPTRTGVLPYWRGGKVVRELRPPEELVKALDQIARAPITNVHRKASPEDLEHFEGLLGHDVVLQDDGWVRTTAQVMVAKAIKDIENNNRRQLSGGFDRVRFDATPGYWDQTSQLYQLDGAEPPEGFKSEGAIRFDGIQRDLQFSHAMLCKASRAGAGARIAYDDLEEDDGIEVEEGYQRHDTKEKKRMPMIKIDGIDYEVEDELAKAIRDDRKARYDELESVKSEVEGLKGEIKALTEEKDGLKGQVTALEAQRHDTPDHSALTKRLKILATAKKVGVDYLKANPLDCTKSDNEVMKDAVAKRYDSIKIEEVSDAEIAGMFRVLQAEEPPRYDSLLDAAVRSNESGGSGNNSRNDDDGDVVSAHDEMCKKLDTPSVGEWDHVDVSKNVQVVS